MRLDPLGWAKSVSSRGELAMGRRQKVSSTSIHMFVEEEKINGVREKRELEWIRRGEEFQTREVEDTSRAEDSERVVSCPGEKTRAGKKKKNITAKKTRRIIQF